MVISLSSFVLFVFYPTPLSFVLSKYRSLQCVSLKTVFSNNFSVSFSWHFSHLSQKLQVLAAAGGGAGGGGWRQAHIADVIRPTMFQQLLQFISLQSDSEMQDNEFDPIWRNWIETFWNTYNITMFLFIHSIVLQNNTATVFYSVHRRIATYFWTKNKTKPNNP